MYLYKNYFKKDMSWEQVRCLFPSTSLPEESRITTKLLLKLGIVRYPADSQGHEETLESAKEKKISELTQARDEEEFKNITSDRGEFKWDSLSQLRIYNAMAAMTDEEVRLWSTVAGERVAMTKKDFNTLFTIASVNSDSTFAKLNDLVEQVNACTTIEAVKEIRW